jgi:predicted transcriptional regulator
MVNARDEVVRQVEQMLAQVGMKASPFAKVAGLSSTTLTRFLKNPHAPVLTTSTMVKLRDARDRILATRGSTAHVSQLTKNAKKRALIARLLELPDNDLVTVENAIKSIPKATARERDDGS